MHIEEAQLESFISDSGLVSKKDFDAARKSAETSGQSIDQVLVNRGILAADELRRIQAYILGLPFVSLKDQKLDFTLLTLIPEPIARTHNVVVFGKGDGAVEVAMLEISDLSALQFLVEKTGLKLLPRLTDEESMKHALLQYQRALKAEFGDVIEKGAIAQNGVAIVDALLRHALLQDVSDIHIEPHEKGVVVRYRVKGKLYEAMVLPAKSALAIGVRLKSLAGLKIEESEIVQEGHFVLETEREKISIRVSALPTVYGEKIALRLIKANSQGFTLEGLGFEEEKIESIFKALHEKGGLILVVGPKGSGKTTTLYTLLDLMNTPALNIATIEDPVEGRLPRVTQTQVRPEIGLNFESGLRAILRQDPDVVMVGELGSREVLELALGAAERGVKILASVEADSGEKALSKLHRLGANASRLNSALQIVIDQSWAKRRVL